MWETIVNLAAAAILFGLSGYLFKKMLLEKVANKALDLENLGICLAIIALGIACLSTSHHQAYNMGEGKIMTPEGLRDEIFILRGQSSLLNGEVIAVVQDGQKEPYAVRIPELLTPEPPYVKKRQVTSATYTLVPADYGDPIKDYEKRNSKLKEANDQDPNKFHGF